MLFWVWLYWHFVSGISGRTFDWREGLLTIPGNGAGFCTWCLLNLFEKEGIADTCLNLAQDVWASVWVFDGDKTKIWAFLHEQQAEGSPFLFSMAWAGCWQHPGHWFGQGSSGTLPGEGCLNRGTALISCHLLHKELSVCSVSLCFPGQTIQRVWPLRSAVLADISGWDSSPLWAGESRGAAPALGGCPGYYQGKWMVLLHQEQWDKVRYIKYTKGDPSSFAERGSLPSLFSKSQQSKNFPLFTIPFSLSSFFPCCLIVYVPVLQKRHRDDVCWDCIAG